ncbi:MAG: hypothetical protein ACLU18_17080 [Bacteroides thetaiotaomicron]
MAETATRRVVYLMWETPFTRVEESSRTLKEMDRTFVAASTTELRYLVDVRRPVVDW